MVSGPTPADCGLKPFPATPFPTKRPLPPLPFAGESAIGTIPPSIQIADTKLTETAGTAKTSVCAVAVA